MFAEVQSIQYLAHDESDKGEGFRFQATDAPDLFEIVTTPKPTGLPVLYNGTEITLPMCGSGADSKKGKMTWKVNNMYTAIDFVDFALGHTLTQRVDIKAHMWVDGKAKDVSGGLGIVEIYHRL